MTPTDILATLARIKVVPVIRAGSIEPATRAALWLAEAGMTAVEMTLTTPDVFDGIARLRRSKSLVVGAGTVLSAQDARLAIAAGSQFLVTPCWVDGVIELAKSAGIPVMIGAANPTEIWRAHCAGATAVKVFPAATVGGPQFLRQVRAVFPTVPLMPTGGVTISTAKDYLAAGAFCVGLGSELAPAKALEAGDKAGVVSRAMQLLASLGPETLSI
jgi:2-dehydro-3-deoxyphosphogluconate aldolase / (4S)-4-hydroxy-2-oxoglutarate aldolase